MKATIIRVVFWSVTFARSNDANAGCKMELQYYYVYIIRRFYYSWLVHFFTCCFILFYIKCTFEWNCFKGIKHVNKMFNCSIAIFFVSTGALKLAILKQWLPVHQHHVLYLSQLVRDTKNVGNHCSTVLFAWHLFMK